MQVLFNSVLEKDYRDVDEECIVSLLICSCCSNTDNPYIQDPEIIRADKQTQLRKLTTMKVDFPIDVALEESSLACLTCGRLTGRL